MSLHTGTVNLPSASSGAKSRVWLYVKAHSCQGGGVVACLACNCLPLTSCAPTVFPR